MTVAPGTSWMYRVLVPSEVLFRRHRGFDENKAHMSTVDSPLVVPIHESGAEGQVRARRGSRWQQFRWHTKGLEQYPDICFIEPTIYCGLLPLPQSHKASVIQQPYSIQAYISVSQSSVTYCTSAHYSNSSRLPFSKSFSADFVGAASRSSWLQKS